MRHYKRIALFEPVFEAFKANENQKPLPPDWEERFLYLKNLPFSNEVKYGVADAVIGLKIISFLKNPEANNLFRQWGSFSDCKARFSKKFRLVWQATAPFEL